MLLGLDMLKRHQATIDLKKNCLHIASSTVPFLSEAELPASARYEPPETKPAPAAAPPPPATASAPPRNEEEEAKIKTLVDLGFPREKAILALRQAQGNVEVAAGLLFSM